MKRKFLICGVCAGLFFSACKKDLNQEQSVSASSQTDAIASNANYKPKEILVKFKAGIAENQRSSVLALVQGKIKKYILSEAMKRFGDKQGVYVINIPGDVQAAVSKLKGHADLIYAEPNFIYQHCATSNDPYFTTGKLWGMYGDLSTPANQYGSQAAEAWANGHTGKVSIVVGVIDEGAMFSHEDLAGNYRANPFDKADGVDNDGNGYIDDVHGWDFFNHDNTTFDGTTDDHGTHVSGTVGATGGNGIGVVGVNWKVSMLSGKFLGPFGGSSEDGALAVDYMTDFKIRHNLKLVSLNNSWGGGGYSQTLKDAIDRADSANILFVAAAGNYSSNNDASPFYPSSYTSENIISVASITSAGLRSSFSNYGLTTVDIGAPGSGIYSTLPGAGNTSTYGSYDGTSMATPHVTGAAALYASTHLTATAAQIKAAILSSAIPTASLSGKCVTGGRLNLSGF